MSELSERRAARRQELLDATIRALGRHGSEASMDQIAEEAGITKPILYRHFGDKRGLVVALAIDYMAQLRSALSEVEAADLRELTRGQLDAALGFLEGRPGLFEFLIKHRGFEESAPNAEGGSHLDHFRRFVESVLRSRGKPVDAAGPLAAGMAALFGSTVLWWLEQKEMSRERFVELITAMLWDGLDQLLGPGPGPDEKLRGPSI